MLFEHATTVNWATTCVRGGGEKSCAVRLPASQDGCLPVRIRA